MVDTIQRLRSRYKLGDMGILVRTNAQTRAIEDELLAREIPYSLVGGTRFYDRSEIKDLVAYLRVLRNPRDNFSLLRDRQPAAARDRQVDPGAAARPRRPARPAALGRPLPGRPRQPAAAQRHRAAQVPRPDRGPAAGRRASCRCPPCSTACSRPPRYMDLFRKDDPDDMARLENIREFLSAAQEFTESNSYNSGATRTC